MPGFRIIHTGSVWRVPKSALDVPHREMFTSCLSRSGPWGKQNNNVPASLYPVVEGNFLQLIFKRYGQNMRPLDKRVNKLKRKRKETAEKANSTASTADGWVKPSMGKSPDNAVVRATGTPPPELPKNQESVLGSLITTPMQNSRRVQTKHQDSPKLVYIKSKDKTKDSGKKQPRKLNSSSSAVNTTPSPEKTVSENTHIHKSRARALWVRNKNPRTESSCDAGVYSYEVSENYYESFSQ
ncbi:uncharacterized protein LOC117882196 isoform X1 [Trachemys scripta elegans]|uniref:uncharacterized protein LOC117882196 isoform X1 n=1 Tax=Trachemys scripta elegans TaxID=31138 RepID=UPI0015550E72|nr:uncharacterized protein LOC117882196 isoform X1 [Trachemys scripta elegans]